MGVDVEPGLIGNVKEPQHLDRPLAEGGLVGHVEAPALGDEPGDLAAPRAAPEKGLALVALFERGAKDAGQIADVLGDQEVVLHEALDAQRARAVGIVQEPPDLGLHVEGQPLLGAPAQRVQVAAYRPQKGLGLGEGAKLGRAQHTMPDQRRDLVEGEQELADPVERVKVAEPALALLDIGLHHIARIAEAPVARVALGELGLDEARPAPRHHLGGEAAAELGVEVGVAPHQARFQHRGGDRDVALAQPQAVVDRARGVADLEPQVPQHIERVLDHLLAPRRQLVGIEEPHIHVRVRRQLAAAVAAYRNRAQPLAGGWVGGAVDPLAREVQQCPHQFVHGAGRAARGVEAGGAAVEAPSRLVSVARQRRLERRQDLSPRRRLAAADRRQRLAKCWVARRIHRIDPLGRRR